MASSIWCASAVFVKTIFALATISSARAAVLRTLSASCSFKVCSSFRAASSLDVLVFKIQAAAKLRMTSTIIAMRKGRPATRFLVAFGRRFSLILCLR
ncbi:MAG: hypothetical protein D6724_01395 [Armatimonadetes bacterium]|nr:MAG: hypothetical protein D6724_01395 [Armatimonadota bacterium]